MGDASANPVPPHEIAVVGVLLRTDLDQREPLARRLGTLEQVEIFSVDDPLRLGVVIEAHSMEEAERVFHEEVSSAPGVLGAWPVYAHYESDEGE